MRRGVARAIALRVVIAITLAIMAAPAIGAIAFIVVAMADIAVAS